MKNKIYDLPNIGDRRRSFYGKAIIVEDENGTTLLSYCTPVCRLNNDGTFIRLWSGYSMTTMRHINSFLKFFNLPGGGKSWWDALPIAE